MFLLELLKSVRDAASRLIQLLNIFAVDVDVFVAASGEIHDEDLALDMRARGGWLRQPRAPIRAPE